MAKSLNLTYLRIYHGQVPKPTCLRIYHGQVPKPYTLGDISWPSR